MKFLTLLFALAVAGCAVFTENAEFGIAGERAANAADDYARDAYETLPRYGNYDGGVFDCLEYAQAAQGFHESQGGSGKTVSYPIDSYTAHAIYLLESEGNTWVIDINRRPMPLDDGHPFFDWR